MRYLNAKGLSALPIGRLGENEATTVVFDISGWRELYGDGAFGLVHLRPGDAAAYPCVIEQDSNAVKWTVQSADLAKQGYGKCELIYTVGGTIAKSEIYTTFIGEALTGGAEPPEPWEDWVQRVLEAGQAAEEAKEEWENMTASAVQLPAGADPTADYEAGHLTIGIPKPVAETYIHQQQTAESEWMINHNLNKYPSVTVVDSGGSKVTGDVDYLDANTVKLTFSAPFGGTAYLN